jgi:hypothetical protein
MADMFCNRKHRQEYRDDRVRASEIEERFHHTPTVTSVILTSSSTSAAVSTSLNPSP